MSTFFSLFRKRLGINFLLFVVMSTMVLAPITPTGQLQKAEALVVTVAGGAGTIQETISAGANTLVAGLQQSLWIKEWTLDGIFHGLAKLVLKSMTQSILNWINSGFQGSPAFASNLKALLLERIGLAVGDFIYNDPNLNFLCSPFQLDVKIALATSFQESADGALGGSQCTINDVSDNVEGFLNGAFSEGGWDGWFELTQNPTNTPTGALLAAETEMYARIIDEQNNVIQELDWGNGFLSFKVCDVADAASGAGKKCDITTPGSVIANQINKSLGAGQDALISADEINEVIGALFAQLAKQALIGLGGLLGLGGGSYGVSSFGDSGSSTYLDALGEERENEEAITSENPFAQAIVNHDANIVLQERIVSLVNEVEAQQRVYTEMYPDCFSSTLPTDLRTTKSDATFKIIVSTSTRSILVENDTAFQTAADPAEQLTIIQFYQELQADGDITSALDNNLLEIFIDFQLIPDLGAYSGQMSARANGCDGDDDD